MQKPLISELVILFCELRIMKLGKSQPFCFASFIRVPSERRGLENVQKVDWSELTCNSLPQLSYQELQDVSDIKVSCLLSEFIFKNLFLSYMNWYLVVSCFLHELSWLQYCLYRAVFSDRIPVSVLWTEGSFLVRGPGNTQSLPGARRPLPAGALTSYVCWTNTVYLWALVFITCKTEIEKLWNFRAERHCRGHLAQELQIQKPSEPRKVLQLCEIIPLRQQGVA